MANNILKHLHDAREAVGAIFRFVSGKTFGDYERDELLRSGIERKFEIIGEALNRVRRDAPAMLDRSGSTEAWCRSGTFSHTAMTVLMTGLCGELSKRT
jgi:hypothetical protein